MTNVSDNINKAAANYKTEEERQVESNVNTAVSRETATFNPARVEREFDNSSVGRSARKIAKSVTESRVGRAAGHALDAGHSTYDFFMGPPPNREQASMHQDNIEYLRRPAVKTRGPPPAIRGIDFREPQGISIAPEPRYLFGGGGGIGGGMPRAPHKPKKKPPQQRNNRRDSLF